MSPCLGHTRDRSSRRNAFKFGGFPYQAMENLLVQNKYFKQRPLGEDEAQSPV